MTEYLKCEKCNKIFAKRTRTGPGFGGMPAWYMSSGEGVCPHCFGEVIWIDEEGIPLSPHKRMKYYNKRMRVIVIWIILIVVIVFIISQLT